MSDTVQIYNEPGIAVPTHPAGGHPGVAFIFRDTGTTQPRTRDERIAALRSAYAQAGWRTGELLDLTEAAPDLYYDNVVRIRTPEWSRGRVTLLGDAAGSLTTLGEGASMALIGAEQLSRALDREHDFATALRAYERQHRQLVERKQRGARTGVAALVPITRRGIQARNLLVKITRRV